MSPASPVRLVAAAPTPMRPNGDLDLDTVPRLVDHLVNEGVDGIFCCGSTGEGESLTPEERRAVAKAFVRAASGRLQVWVQVGTNSLRLSRELAAHAAEIGASALAATPPSYFKPASVLAVVEGLKEIAAGAPELPLVYYHFPGLTGVSLDLVDLMKVARSELPTFSGAKLSEADPDVLRACKALEGGRYDAFWGQDHTLLTGLAAGGTEAIGATYSYAAGAYRRVIDAHRSGDRETAERWQDRCARMVDIQMRHGGFPAFKATMGLIGLDCGPVRLPQRRLAATDVESMRAALEAIGFFGWRTGG